MVNYVDTLKEVRRVSESALAERDSVFEEYDDTACGYAAVSGLMTSVMREIASQASSTLEVCGELYWSKFTQPDDIAREIANELINLLKCPVVVGRTGDNGDEDIGYEFITIKHGSFCIAVVLEGLMWRVYSLPISKCNKPLRNVGELIKEACDNE